VIFNRERAVREVREILREIDAERGGEIAGAAAQTGDLVAIAD